MATIQRPIKTYGTRSYVAEVAAAPGNEDPVLSVEVDADLDTIYSAWNGGADTVNIKDGAVTWAKLATDARIWQAVGATVTPSDATKTVAVPVSSAGGEALRVGSRTVKGRLIAPTLADNSYLTINRSLNAPETAWVRDDTAKAAWALQLSTAADAMYVARIAPGGGADLSLFTLDNGSTLTLSPPGASLSAGVSIYGYGSGGLYKSYQARGAPGAPTASQNGDILGQFGALGYGTAYAEQSLIRFLADETWTATAHGTKCIIYTTQVTQASLNQTLVFDGFGNLIISGAVGQKSSGTTWANPSDRRLKDDITDYTTGLDAILALQPRSFVYNGKGGSQAGLRGYSFIADEVVPVMPEMVGTTRAKLDPDDQDETEIQTLDTSNLALALVNAVKELAARVTALEAR